jgi:GT2 family glycosyltransferase
VVHFGDQRPTVRLANSLVNYGTCVVCVANDRSARPSDLDPTAEWLIAPRNLGYGGAFVEAVRGRDSDVYVLLNTDIVLPFATFQRCLNTLLTAEDVGIVGPVLRYEDGALQSGAGRVSRWRRAPLVHTEPGVSVVDCEWVTGAVMFVRREVAEGVGMDGSFFLGGEDIDFCVRARRSGWRVQCRGDAPAIHHGSQILSGPRWSYYSARNRVWFARQNFGPAAALLSWACQAALLPRVVLADLVKRRDMTSSRLSVMGLRHAWWPKPSSSDGPLLGEPFPAQIMNW